MKTDLKDEVKQKENNTDSASLIVYNDDVNTFDHVILCLIAICGHTSHQAEQCAMIVHNSGKCKVKSGGLDEMIKMAEKLIDNDLTVEVIQSMHKYFLAIGTFFAGIAVFMGTMGLNQIGFDIVDKPLYDSVVRYQMIHAAGMITLYSYSINPKVRVHDSLWASGIFFTFGIILFSIPMYAVAFEGLKGSVEVLCRMVATIGNICFILAWGLWCHGGLVNSKWGYPENK